MTQALPVVIAGGGIGGVAAALGLARKGVPSVVLERSAELGEIGAGIQLGPNAFHCFDYLGVGERARAAAVYIDSLRLMDALSAEQIAAIPLGDEPGVDGFQRGTGAQAALGNSRLQLQLLSSQGPPDEQRRQCPHEAPGVRPNRHSLTEIRA